MAGRYYTYERDRYKAHNRKRLCSRHRNSYAILLNLVVVEHDVPQCKHQISPSISSDAQHNIKIEIVYLSKAFLPSYEDAEVWHSKIVR